MVELLNIQIKIPPFSAKSGPAHFRWKSSTALRRKRGKAQEQPIHPMSLLLIIVALPKLSKTRKIVPLFS
jgi:hypothetical protein